MSSKHLLTKSDFYYPVGVCVEGLFFGFYTAVFIAALWIWGKRRSHSGPSATFSGWMYLILIVLMWIVAGLHFGMSLQRFLRVYILELQADSLPIAIRLMDSGKWDTLAHMILTTMMIWLGDILVLYRTFIVWDRKVWVIVLPVLIHVSYLVMNGMAIYALSHPHIIPRKTALVWYQPVFPLIFTQNVITTGLLFYKVFAQHRSSAANGVSNSNGQVRLGHLAWMLVETAMFYTLELFVIIILGISQHPAKGIVSVSLVPTLGIVFVLLSVRVHFGAAPKDSSRRNTGTMSNFPNLFRDSVLEDNPELGNSPASAPTTTHLDVAQANKLRDVAELNTQNSEFEDQDSYPTVSFSRKTSREGQ